MQKLFNLDAHGTTIKREILAGFISFITIVYIVIVNSKILSEAGIPYDAAMIGTILTCVFGCIIMGLWSNSPIILVPGMGINAMFTYTIVINGNYSWQEALGIVFLSGILFILIAFTPLANKITKAIPHSLKVGITVGIGILLMFIGFEQSGIIVSSPETIVALGDLTNMETLLTIFGLIITFILFTRNIPGNLLISVAIITTLAIILGVVKLDGFEWTQPSFSAYGEVFGAMSFTNIFSIGFLLTAFSMAMVVTFENIGLIQAHTASIKQPEKSNKALKANALSVLTCGIFGSSPTVATVETAAGITAGGRTGLTAVTTGVLFLASLFLIPIIKIIPNAAISPILILIGALMIQNITEIDLNDLTESFPALLVIVLIPLTFSIANGMAIGFIAYPLVKFFLGKKRDVSVPLYIIALLFTLNFVFQYTSI